MKYPFEALPEEIAANPETFVSTVFSCLESEFMIMPKGTGFIEYDMFEAGYEALKRVSGGFIRMFPDDIYSVAVDVPISIIVLRAILGFTPPEWAYVATERTGVQVSQGFARTLDRKIRMSPTSPLTPRGDTESRLKAMIQVACDLITDGAPGIERNKLHRLDKADTRMGLQGITNLASIAVPYAMLLYERFLGRPFSSHRDSVSELVGASLESAIEEALARSGVSFRKTGRAERIEGFDQAPDFVIPSEFNPRVVIEAKLTEDDGTARDKVTRIQHLAAISMRDGPSFPPRFEVIACIGGRGFGVRREDMKKMLLATGGKVFTMNTLDRLVECTLIRDYKTR